MEQLPAGVSVDASPRAPQPSHEHRDWFVASGAQRLAAASDVSYAEYAQRARERRALPATFDEDLTQIQLDLDRIGPSLKEFLLGIEATSDAGEEEDEWTEQSGEYAAFVATLRSVLMAYSVRNARVGYVQGHADLLCFVLAHTPSKHDEEQAFWIYATVVERIFPDDFFVRSPKLHGFHVDVKLFEELLAKRLVPHVPQLANVDLAFVSSLLACKWFIPVWVGELPHSLLVEVWDAMLCEDDGTFLHLLLSLHFVRLACDALVASGDSAMWEASFVYKEVLAASRGLAATTSLASIRHQARAVYNLSDEGLEDWRATLRGQTAFLASETRALIQTVHFQPPEIARFHDEFMFARMYLKKCERLHLRGLRREFVDGLLTRAFPMLSTELARRIVDLLRRDAYGNISFFRLMQLLSVLLRGSTEERAMLLFSVADRRHCLELDRKDVGTLADLLCGLAVHQTLHGCPDLVETNADWAAQLNRQRRPEHSPLLRAHFLSLAEGMRNDAECLTHDAWLQAVPTCEDVCALLKSWDSTPSGNIKKTRSHSGGVQSLLRRSSASHPSNTLATLAQAVSLTRTNRGSPVKAKRIVDAGAGRDRAKSSEQPSHPHGTSPQLSLLSGRMLKKYVKRSKTQPTGNNLRSIGNASQPSMDPALDATLSISNRVFWCECVIS